MCILPMKQMLIKGTAAMLQCAINAYKMNVNEHK